MILPNNERTFPFNEKGDTTLEDFKGDFTVKCVLNMLEKRMLAIENAKLKSDVTNPTPELSAHAHIMSTLKVRIIESPDWWKTSDNGNNLLDENICVLLFDKVIDQEVEWRKELKAKAGDSDQGN